MKKLISILLILILNSCSYSSKTQYDEPTEDLAKIINHYYGPFQMLKNMKKTQKGYKWEVWSNFSGVYLRADDLEVWINGREIIFDGGTEMLVSDLKKWINDPTFREKEAEEINKIFLDPNYEILKLE